MIIYKAITGVIILMNRDDKYDPPHLFQHPVETLENRT